MSRFPTWAITLAAGPLGVLFTRGVLWLGTDQWKALDAFDTGLIAFLSMFLAGAALLMARDLGEM